MRIYGSKYVLPMTCRQTEPFYVYSMTMPDNYGNIIHCEENMLAAKTMMSELALFSSKSCEFPQKEMDIELDAIKMVLDKCLKLPGLRGKVQKLIDNLGM